MVKRNDIMKKEYLILILLILALSAYLFFKTEDKDHFPVPSVAKMTPGNISGLEITKKEDTIHLVKQDGKWMLQGLDRPADNAAVDNILDVLKDFRLSALVSQKKDVNRYELDKDNKIDVKVIEGDSPVFEFSLGKTAPTYNHTFVMVAGDSNIYHAKGNFRSDFDKTAEDLRDKTVLTFKEKAVKSLTIEKDGLSMTFTATQGESKDQEPEISWQSSDKKAVDKQSLTDLLSAMAHLECEKFLATDQRAGIDTQPPLCRISLEGDSRMTVKLVKTSDDAPLSGITSMAPDAFVLSKFNGDDLMEKVDKLLGIEPVKPEEK